MRITIEATPDDEAFEAQHAVTVEGPADHGSEVASLIRYALAGYGFTSKTIDEYIPEVPIGEPVNIAVDLSSKVRFAEAFRADHLEPKLTENF